MLREIFKRSSSGTIPSDCIENSKSRCSQFLTSRGCWIPSSYAILEIVGLVGGLDLMVFHAKLARRATSAIATAAIAGVTPLATSLPARAQTQSEAVVAQQRVIRAENAQEQTLYLNSDRTYSYDLIVENDTRIGDLYIPAGSVIEGYYDPAPGKDGLRYVATAALIDGRRYSLDAVSEALPEVKDPRDTSGGSVAEDAAIGAAAGTLLGEIFGDADVEEIVGGAAAGAGVGNVTADRVVVVEPNETIMLYPS